VAKNLTQVLNSTNLLTQRPCLASCSSSYAPAAFLLSLLQLLLLLLLLLLREPMAVGGQTDVEPQAGQHQPSRRLRLHLSPSRLLLAADCCLPAAVSCHLPAASHLHQADAWKLLAL
jgi:ABC-type Fe3+ transport system permease subunit